MKPKKKLCPGEKDANGVIQDSWCDASKSAENADSYSFVAAGVGFSKLCNRKIPEPEAPELPIRPTGLSNPVNGRRLFRRETTCLEDQLFIDMVPDDEDECKNGLQKRADNQCCKDKFCLSLLGEILDKNCKCKKCTTGVPTLDGKDCQKECPSGEFLPHGQNFNRKKGPPR